MSMLIDESALFGNGRPTSIGQKLGSHYTRSKVFQKKIRGFTIHEIDLHTRMFVNYNLISITISTKWSFQQMGVIFCISNLNIVLLKLDSFCDVVYKSVKYVEAFFQIVLSLFIIPSNYHSNFYHRVM